MFEGYQYNIRFNALHNVLEDRTQSHSHTFEVVLYIEPNEKKIVTDYNDYEKFVLDYFNPLRGKLLNDLPKFKNILPTIENMGEVFYTELLDILKNENFNLIQLEISEIPTRVYVLSSKILI